MTTKAVFRFTAASGPGWSETWYRGDTNNMNTLQAAQQPQVGWIAVRRTLLHDNFRIRDVRISNVDQQRDGLVAVVNLSGLYTAVVPRLNEAMAANLGVKARLYIGANYLHWRTSLLRGISEDATTDGVTVDPGSNYPPNFGHFVSMLSAQAWQLQLQTRGLSVNLLAVTLSDNQITQLTLSGVLAGAIPGATVEVTNSLGMSNVNEKYTILKVDPTNLILTVRKRLRKSYGVVVPGSGTVYIINKTYEIIDQLTSSSSALSIGTRKTGRPSGLPAGKRRVQRG